MNKKYLSLRQLLLEDKREFGILMSATREKINFQLKTKALPVVIFSILQFFLLNLVFRCHVIDMKVN